MVRRGSSRLRAVYGASGLFVVAATAVLAACSGSVDQGPSMKDACSDYATIFRTREISCYRVAPEPDETALVARQVQSCVLASSAPGSTVTASYWESCAVAANNGCNAYQCPTYPAGAGQPGAACLDGTQCASLWCRGTQVVDKGGSISTSAVQCGTCSDRLAEGAYCNVATDVCAIGLSCFDGACRTQGQINAPCTYARDCAPPLTCKSYGACGEVAFTGQQCVTDGDCTTDQGCDPSTHLCAPFQFGQPGAACDNDVRICEAGYCTIAAGATTGTCPTVLADGAPCDPSDPSTVCGGYASCFDGTCNIPDPASCK